jgi:hypothetical protein
LIAVDSNKGVTTLIQGTLQADDNELERVGCLTPDIVGDLGNVCIIQSSVYFIKDEKWRRLVAKSL